VSILSTILNAKRIEIDAVVTKADGTIVNHGTVAFYDRNPVSMLCWNLKQALLRGSKRVSTLFKGQ